MICLLALLLLAENALAGNCLNRSDTLTIRRQSQLDSFSVNYPGCTNVKGTLIISGNTINNLSGLNGLNHIEFLNISDNPLLISLNGLNNLQTAGNIFISRNSGLLSLNGLEQLDSVNTILEVMYNPSLVTLDGLNSLQKVKNTLSIYGNASLTSLDGLEDIRTMYRLSVYGNPLMTSLLGLNPFVRLNIVDIWENENLRCCEVVNQMKLNNPVLLSSRIFSNADGCNSAAEIMNSSGSQNCCKTEFSVQAKKICPGQSIVVGANTYSVAGVYIDSFFSITGCDSVLYTALNIGQPSYTIIQKTLCMGQVFTLANGNVVSSSGVYRDTVPFTCDSIVEYHINFVSTSILTMEVAICDGQRYTLPDGKLVSEPGIYTDTIKNGLSCDSIYTVTLTRFPNNFSVSLPSEQLVPSGQEISITPSYTNGSAVAWQWKPNDALSCLDCEQPTAIPLKNDIYEVNVQSSDGCEDTASIRILVPVPDIYIPQAFSPNGDQVNDDFNVIMASPMLFSLKVYNRYGELLYYSNDLSQRWNGTYKGEPCSVDTYIYFIDATTFNEQQLQKKGVVQLLR